MKYILFSLLILLSGGDTPAQNRIFVNSTDLKDTSFTEKILKIKIPWGNLGSTIIVMYNDGTKSVLKKTKVWGYQIKNEIEIKRFYEGQIYSIVEMDEIIIYKSYARHPEYFFSDDLNGSIKYLTKRNIIKTVGIDRFNRAYQKSKFIRKII